MSTAPSIRPWDDPFKPEQRQFFHKLVNLVETHFAPELASDLPHRFLGELAEAVRKYDEMRTEHIEYLHGLLADAVSLKRPTPMMWCAECPHRKVEVVPG